MDIQLEKVRCIMSPHTLVPDSRDENLFGPMKTMITKYLFKSDRSRVQIPNSQYPSHQ